jgi:hypothetical protein
MTEEQSMAQSIPNDDGSLRVAISEVLAQIKAARVEMARDQQEIDRMKAETAELKAKGDSIRSETRAILAAVKASLNA